MTHEINQRWQRYHLEDRETIVTILCEKAFIDVGWVAIQTARQELDLYIQDNPVFRTSHRPLQLQSEMPEAARRMTEAASRVEVGPMAAVAGTLAWLGVEAMQAAGAAEAVVDNGGDIAFWIKEPAIVGIYAGPAFNSLAFKVDPRDAIFGICTSSGTIGPSTSYGHSDAAIAISEDVALADAAATALGNRVKSRDHLEGVFDFLQETVAIEGAAVVVQDQLALWGSVPEIVRSDVNPDLITRGQAE